MKGYKAFKKGLIRDPTGKNPFQYAENTVFETDTAEPCKSGFHFCKNPLDVLDYYPLVDRDGNLTEFAEVEALGDVKTDDNKKYCTKKLKIGAKLTLPQFIKTSIDVTYENIKTEIEKETKKIKNSDGNATPAGGEDEMLVGGNNTILAGGYNALVAGGKWATLAGGDGATVAGGNDATVAGGCLAKLTGGENATLAGGDDATVVGGDNAKLVGGNNTILAGGDGVIIAGGYNTLLAGGDDAILAGDCNATLIGGGNSLMVGDNGSIAKGKKGAVILLVERDTDYNILNFNAVQVDGEKNQRRYIL